MIPFLDLRAAYLELKPDLDRAVASVLDSGWYIGGPVVERFEREYAEYCGAKYSVGLANGLDALHLALKALGVGPGDDVVVPSNTYIATWLAVEMCGAKVVPVEPDLATFCIDPNKIEDSLTARTKVILPVHLYGHPADMDAILSIAKDHGLKVVEDGAQAHGAKYKDRRLGAHGDLVAWSFFPSKNLGAFGDAGGVTTDDAFLADKIAVLRNYGSRKKYVNEVKGVNSRLDPVHAAVLSVKLRHLDEWNARRSRIAAEYQSRIVNPRIELPTLASWASSAWHLFVVRTKSRDRFQAYLADKGVGTLVHYPIPPHKQAAYAELSNCRFPLSEALAEEVLSLPLGPQMAKDQVDAVIDAVNAFDG